MILRKLVLKNYGPYAGRHELDLLSQNDKPITLIGALNGSGKTSVLDALQLALYGKRARCSARVGLGYNKFLRRSIHTGPNGVGEECGVSLSFDLADGDRWHAYEVARTWMRDKALRERVEVYVDGVIRRDLAKRWDEVVESILPERIAHLFFFDGEKIEAYAQPETASSLLKVAIHSLLGLDLVDQLHHDLTTLQRRQLKVQADPGLKADIERAEHALEVLVEEREELDRAIAERHSKALELDAKINSIEERYEAAGGALLEDKQRLEDEKRELQGELHTADEKLRELARGIAPLAFVRSLRVAAQRQIGHELDADRSQEVLGLLRNRDEQILALLTEVDSTAKQKIEQFMTTDTARRKEQLEQPVLIGAPRPTHDRLAHLTVRLEESIGEWKAARQERQEGLNALFSVDRLIEAAPDEAALTELIRLRQTTVAARDELRRELDDSERDRDRLEQRLELSRNKLNKTYDRAAREELGHHEVLRLVKHAKQAQQTMTAFRSALVRKHVASLESKIAESYAQLLRKRSLVSKVVIDPDTFELRVLDSAGQTRSLERLSAGERQLLAQAILWGLARAAKGRFPVVIDTPMGRLDSVHRANLLERYFPEASHQVVLLSTDEEIDQAAYAKVADHVGQHLVLSFADELESSQVVKGTLWEANA